MIPITVASHFTSCFDVIDGEKVLLKVPNPINHREYIASIFIWKKSFAAELRSKFFEMWDNNSRDLQMK
ncbi:MAG: DUF7436 family protein [Candidatus Hodarchaeales archaeon]|jgi:hypothetical protein